MAADDRQRELAAMIGANVSKKSFWRSVATYGGIAFVIGFGIAPIVAGGLPFGWNTRVSALVMRQGRWEAGAAALMEAESPSNWRAFVVARDLVEVNQEAVRAWRAAPATSSKGKICSVVIPFSQPDPRCLGDFRSVDFSQNPSTA